MSAPRLADKADRDEIAATARQIRALLDHGSVRPALVTVARSVDDGFTPPEAWPFIEWTLLGELARGLPAGSTIRFDAGQAPAPRNDDVAMPTPAR